MPVTRRQKRLGIVLKPYTPGDRICLAAKYHDELMAALKRQILKNERRRPRPEVDFVGMTFDEWMGEWKAACRETDWKTAVRNLVKSGPNPDMLITQVEDYQLFDEEPRVSARTHRFIRLWEENAALIRDGF
jgi:hypothetical protein